MKKILLIVAVGLGVGYILGARAGRERYDEIVGKVTGVWEDPRVAKARHEAARYAREQAPVVRDRAQAVAKDVASRTATTARKVTGKTVDVARSAAARVGEARDDLLEDDHDD